MEKQDKEKRTFLMKLTSDALYNVHQGNKNDALKCYEQILEKYPKEVKAIYGKGMVYYQFDELEQALICFDEALKLDAKDVDSLYGKGSILSRLGKFENALEYFDQAITNDPDLAIAVLAKGYLLLDLRKAEEALACFKKVAKMGLELDALNGKGHAYRQLNKLKDAKKCYEIAIKVNAYDAEALFGLGMLAYDNRELKEAQDFLYKSVVQDEENLPAWITLEKIFKQTNQPEKAQVAHDKIKEIESK